MPLPWKKAKVGRISRFLANVRSMKHEESLVVETGFPTSIADVVVKNRDRFKKHSKKKHSDISDRSLSLNDQASLNYSNSNYCFPSSQVVVPSVETRNPSQPSSKPLLLDPETTNDTRPSISKRSSPVLVVKKVEDVSVRNKIEDVVESPVRNEKAFVAIVNLFLMLVLALGTNNLVLGVMVSVFALLFFESASEYLFIFFKPSSDAHQRLESLGDISLGPEQEDIGIVFQEEEDDGAESEEFGLIESSLDRIEEIRNVEPGFHLLGGVRKMGVSDSVRMGRIPWKDEDNIEVRDLRNQRTNGAKIKAKKLKKFLTKRFRSSKSKKNDKKEMDSSDLASIFRLFFRRFNLLLAVQFNLEVMYSEMDTAKLQKD
ncbi:PREDICTED: uncharacterized protein LOC104610943 [Nelumbo nucifera]|uniref:Uncharacterized protein LOC104610943 n=1 Tax=Nelumbo nucifera TaxID=4432 RepID=A0A1U8QBT3_NELNU|nr:PREDICTED: uncharacterized protein LOC104610943 [Nelumbo nucifera]